jgi:hypothetical protein
LEVWEEVTKERAGLNSKTCGRKAGTKLEVGTMGTLNFSPHWSGKKGVYVIPRSWLHVAAGTVRPNGHVDD